MSKEVPKRNQDGLKEPERQWFYSETECVFEHVPPQRFIDRAFTLAGIDPTKEKPEALKLVKYSTQLAIATHRPQAVRDIEEKAIDAMEQRLQEEKDARLRKKYGNHYQVETVTIGGLSWSLDLADSLRRSMEIVESPDSLFTQEVKADIFDTFQNPNPYHPHKGYKLSYELSHLALAVAGMTEMIVSWDNFGDDKRLEQSHYEKRYKRYFGPDIFVETALEDLKLSKKDVGDKMLDIASTVVSAVILELGPETIQYHERKIAEEIATLKEMDEEPPMEIRRIPPDVLFSESQIKIDFTQLNPDDFSDKS